MMLPQLNFLLLPTTTHFFVSIFFREKLNSNSFLPPLHFLLKLVTPFFLACSYHSMCRLYTFSSDAPFTFLTHSLHLHLLCCISCPYAFPIWSLYCFPPAGVYIVDITSSYRLLIAHNLTIRFPSFYNV